MVKKTRGRQRIPITKITQRSSLQVTFSKRRSGLFKKASEISTLCGADVALIVFSPAEKVFSYGNPCLDTVLDRFVEGTDDSSSPAVPEMMMMQLMQEERNNVQNIQLEHIQSLLENEKRRGEELDRAMEARSHQWWRSPVEELSLEQLEALRDKLLVLKGNIKTQFERVIMLEMANQPPPPPPVHQSYFGGPAGSSSYYGVGDTSGGGGFHGFADPAGPSNQPINVPQPYYNVGYGHHQQQQQQQGFY